VALRIPKTVKILRELFAAIAWIDQYWPKSLKLQLPPALPRFRQCCNASCKCRKVWRNIDASPFKTKYMVVSSPFTPFYALFSGERGRQTGSCHLTQNRLNEPGKCWQAVTYPILAQTSVIFGHFSIFTLHFVCNETCLKINMKT